MSEHPLLKKYKNERAAKQASQKEVTQINVFKKKIWWVWIAALLVLLLLVLVYLYTMFVKNRRRNIALVKSVQAENPFRPQLPQQQSTSAYRARDNLLARGNSKDEKSQFKTNFDMIQARLAHIRISPVFITKNPNSYIMTSSFVIVPEMEWNGSAGRIWVTEMMGRINNPRSGRIVQPVQYYGGLVEDFLQDVPLLDYASLAALPPQNWDSVLGVLEITREWDKQRLTARSGVSINDSNNSPTETLALQVNSVAKHNTFDIAYGEYGNRFDGKYSCKEWWK